MAVGTADGLLTAEEVRDRLGVGHVATVYRWAKEGRLPRVVLSRKVVRFRPEDVERFISSRREGE